MANEEEALDMEIDPPAPEPIFISDEEFFQYVSILQCMGTPTEVQCEVECNIDACYAQLAPKLERINKEMVFMDSHGECFFRAFAHQFFNDEESHPFVRAATILFMSRNPHLYGVDFAQMFIRGTFLQYLQAKSGVFTPVDEIMMQGACDAFSVSIFSVSSFTARPMREFFPKNLVFHKELSMSFVPNHVDSIFNKGEVPLSFHLPDERIQVIRENGAVRHADIAGCMKFMG